MKNFSIMYRILKFLEKAMDVEEPDYEEISSERLRITHTRWEQLLVLMQEDGYIRGLVVSMGLSDNMPHVIEPIAPRITIKGMEFMEENSLMQKVKQGVKDVSSVI